MIPITRGMAGIKALPSWRRHEIEPVSLTARLAVVPRKMPNAVQICPSQENISLIGTQLLKRSPTCHDETAANIGWRDLGGEHGDSHFLQAHTSKASAKISGVLRHRDSPNAEQYTTSYELTPMLGQRRTNRCQKGEDCSNENDPATTQPMIHRV